MEINTHTHLSLKVMHTHAANVLRSTVEKINEYPTLTREQILEFMHELANHLDSYAALHDVKADIAESLKKFNNDRGFRTDKSE